MKTLHVEDLKIVTEFQHVPDEQLQWLISQGETVELEKGELLFNAGDPVITSYLVLDGKMCICAMQSGKRKELRILDPGQPTGYLPYSRATITPAFCEALKRSWIFKCPAERLKAGFTDNYELIEAMVHMMLSRVREFTAIQQQNEKMFALGKLSAGLAHELNNPAAAIARAASLLQVKIGRLPHLYRSIADLRIPPGKAEKISNLIIHKINSEPAALTMMQKAALEDEIADWLLDNHLEEIDYEGLVERRFTIGELEILKDSVLVEELPVLLEWITNYLITNRMTNDIYTSSERISNLVGAVKNFTFMDKDSGRQLTDVHVGIRNTLTILDFKLAKGNIHVIEHYDMSIPKIRALPGGLNQVWLNIIDNAVEAMQMNGKGKLTITSTHDERFVKVSIKDDGPGIPEDIKKDIFTPFFTTKEIGKGTGLGLDVVSRIMTQHNGRVEVRSVPGATEFEVYLPI